jgi:hypothetical protein
MQNKTSAPSLQASTHFLSAGGDLRSMYTPWGAASSGAAGYSYLKCEVVSSSTEVELYVSNAGDKPAVVALSTALIKQDVDLYANPGDNPSVTPPVWATPPVGSGNSGVVTIVPGGRVHVELNVPTSKDAEMDTLAVRVQLTGAAVKIEAWTTGTCELY